MMRKAIRMTSDDGCEIILAAGGDEPVTYAELAERAAERLTPAALPSPIAVGAPGVECGKVDAGGRFHRLTW